jgi:hypothetical protein
MIDISKRIKKISELLEESSRESVVYAALECRLTIEAICYERLEVSYDYISYESLRKWQPHHVVRQITEEGNEQVTQEFSISISKLPTEKDKQPVTREHYESFEYENLGSQAALDVRKLGKLWNALSNASLHVSLPKQKGEQLDIYGGTDKARTKVLESLDEFKKLLNGNLLSSGFGEEYFFNCVDCGTKLRKKAKLITHGQTIACIIPECPESYFFNVEDGEIFHTRRLLSTTCAECDNPIEIPASFIDKLKYGQIRNEKCPSCCFNNEISLIAGRANKLGSQESKQG